VELGLQPILKWVQKGIGPKLGWGLYGLDYFGDAEVSSGIDEDSFEVITDGEVDVCFDGW